MNDQIRKKEWKSIHGIKSTSGNGGIVADGLKPANPARWMARKPQFAPKTDFYGKPIR